MVCYTAKDNEKIWDFKFKFSPSQTVISISFSVDYYTIKHQYFFEKKIEFTQNKYSQKR